MRRILSMALLAMVIVGCAATGGQPDENTHSTAPQSILNKTWQWVSTITPVEKIAVSNPERYTIILKDDGKLQARFDCNRGGGEYEISEGKLSLGPLMSTRMATTIFGLSFLAYGIVIVPYLMILFLCGIALGIAASAAVLRLGPAAEWFIWPLPAVISPFAGVFYPLATLPKWMQALAGRQPGSREAFGQNAC